MLQFSGDAGFVAYQGVLYFVFYVCKLNSNGASNYALLRNLLITLADILTVSLLEGTMLFNN